MPHQPKDAGLDARFMAAAARFALRHLGQTAENPSVGALIVRFEGHTPLVVGRGVTACSGRPHAEVVALKQAGNKAQGATAYVTLEPCSHYGKTPPCAVALIEAGIKRVVVGVLDPDKRVSGNGVAMLRDAGIVVDILDHPDAKQSLSGYLTRKLKNRPEVTLKLALSKDHGIGKRGEGFIAISHETSRHRAHLLRAQSDAIMVGIGTVLADNPRLDCRLDGMEKFSPLRLVVDRDLRISTDSQLVRTAKKIPLWLFCQEKADRQKKALLEKMGVTVITVPLIENQLDLAALLTSLGEKGLSTLLLEGGAGLAQSFYNAHLIDRMVLFQSPVILGGGLIPAPVFLGFEQHYQQTANAHFGQDYCTFWQRTD